MRKSLIGKIFISIIASLIVLSISSKFYKYTQIEDYELLYKVPCDINESSCFVELCESETQEGCINEPYAYVYARANTISLSCSLEESQECNLPPCTDGDVGCSIEFCSEELLTADEKCITQDKSLGD